MVQINGRQAVELSEDLVRHMVLNSLRAHNKKFRKEYGDIVIACDSKNVWRREIFPNYKEVEKQVVKNQIMIGIIFLLYLLKSKTRSRLFYLTKLLR